MTVQQLTLVKRWHVQHRHDRPIELYAWDAMLVFWLIGWMGMPAALVLGLPGGVAACVPMLSAPDLYVSLRRRLHRRALLRCDWLDTLSGSDGHDRPR
jgi:hypothetical protein